MSRHFWGTFTLTITVFAALLLWQRSQAVAYAKERAVAIAQARAAERPAKPLAVPTNARIATFAGGCFWGMEEAFRTEPGVLATQVGYTGGTTPNPTYRTVHQDREGYVEAVEIVYDPHKVAYSRLLTLFYENHDPTLPRLREGHDIGKAYRSFVFYQTEEQKKAAAEKVYSLDHSKLYTAPIQTQLKPASVFWLAEEYHQNYYAKKGEIAQCEP